MQSKYAAVTFLIFLFDPLERANDQSQVVRFTGD